MNWQASANLTALKQRAKMFAQIRHFFAERNVLEVETPLLATSGITDLHLENLTSQYTGPHFPKGVELYLQTSPEYAMKRMLASGSGCIYQICKAFRDDESGRYHNPEFTMLEWYRVGFDLSDLMDEMDSLLQVILNVSSAKRYSYQAIFIEVLDIDPLQASTESLQAFLRNNAQADMANILTEKDDLLQFIFSFFIEQKIAQTQPYFIYDFPASQACLAKLNPDDSRVAKRFEVYFKGVELANGFDELTDATEQRKRFEQDNLMRQANGKHSKPIDENLLSAIAAGLPDCSGVAMGLDRLLMLAGQYAHIKEVISFDLTRC
ncbi:elongation factor P--(R)-beta-lysine ligase [Catenovulum sp. SM1970]|uniref:elongation factor P--(R)-beta-lysine ligase n=1 Tax=Marinifaba aquimaris TaxID=2741323 RepID=UPI00157329DD|nr:elongation factor P--(R)-beta-lysine ligase [Marinifaba aquimaris]NTS75284.1 elongation factor P--(R)-beta-lysine ligase [Marinifaba aquimaris]